MTEIKLELYRKKSLEELSEALSKPESKCQSGTAAAVAAALSAALLCRAAAMTDKGGERLGYIRHNAENLRVYMAKLADDDVSCRAPMNRAAKEGDTSALQACIPPACSVCSEMINMCSHLVELMTELSNYSPREAGHFLAEAAQLAVCAARMAETYILDLSAMSEDDTFRFVARRENELYISQFEPKALSLIEDQRKASADPLKNSHF